MHVSLPSTANTPLILQSWVMHIWSRKISALSIGFVSLSLATQKKICFVPLRFTKQNIWILSTASSHQKYVGFVSFSLVGLKVEWAVFPSVLQLKNYVCFVSLSLMTQNV